MPLISETCGQQVVFFGIDNIHAMRESFARLRDYLDTHGATSSDGVSSYLVSYALMLSLNILLVIIKEQIWFGNLRILET